MKFTPALMFVISVAAFAQHHAYAGAACSSFRREQRVEAQKEGAWAKSTIVRCDAKKGYLVHFDGYPSSGDEWLQEASIRVPPAQLEAEAKNKAALAAAEKAGYKSGDFVFIQRAGDTAPFVAALWNAGPYSWSYMSAGVENRIELGDIKGKWDASKMKYKVGDKVRYVYNGFLPATITSVEGGGYRAKITGYDDPNVITESHFVDDWAYDDFDKTIAPLKALKALNLTIFMSFAQKPDTYQPDGGALPKEEGAGVAEFEKIVRAYEAADKTIKANFPKLPPLERPDCQYCPVTLAAAIGQAKVVLRRAVPLKSSHLVEEFLRLLKPNEENYNTDFRPDEAADTLAAKDGVAHAKQTIDKRLEKIVAYGKVLGVDVGIDAPAIGAEIKTYAAAFDKMMKKKAPLLTSFAQEGTKLTAHEPKLEAAAKAWIAANLPKTTKCKLLGTEKHGWRPDGTGPDHTGRFKYVAFDCSDSQYRYPFAAAVAVKEDHAGFGKYLSSTPHGQSYLYSYYRK